MQHFTLLYFHNVFKLYWDSGDNGELKHQDGETTAATSMKQ